VVRFLDQAKGGEKWKMQVASALMASAFALATLAPAAFAVYPANVDPFAGSWGQLQASEQRLPGQHRQGIQVCRQSKLLPLGLQGEHRVV
jgi:hypothetical protein